MIGISHSWLKGYTDKVQTKRAARGTLDSAILARELYKCRRKSVTKEAERTKHTTAYDIKSFRRADSTRVHH